MLESVCRCFIVFLLLLAALPLAAEERINHQYALDLDGERQSKLAGAVSDLGHHAGCARSARSG